MAHPPESLAGRILIRIALNRCLWWHRLVISFHNRSDQPIPIPTTHLGTRIVLWHVRVLRDGARILPDGGNSRRTPTQKPGTLPPGRRFRLAIPITLSPTRIILPDLWYDRQPGHTYSVRYDWRDTASNPIILPPA
jgi:hypothetical protein